MSSNGIESDTVFPFICIFVNMLKDRKNKSAFKLLGQCNPCQSVKKNTLPVIVLLSHLTVSNVKYY